MKIYKWKCIQVQAFLEQKVEEMLEEASKQITGFLSYDIICDFTLTPTSCN